MKTRDFWKSSLVVLCALLVLGGCAGRKSSLKIGKSDAGEVVEAEGIAPMNAKDLVATKKGSLTDAQRNAVEKVVGVYVSARTFVEKAVAIENNILARTEGYVKKYDILKEWDDNGLYKTKIRALVALKDLEADLKELSLLKSPELHRPRLSVKLNEKVNEKPSEEHAAQSSLERALIQQGYIISSSTEVGSAEVSITGEAASYPFQSEKLGGFVSFRARLSLQARKVGATNVLYSLTKEASGLGGNDVLAGLKALETVGEFAAQELGEKLSDMWSKGQNILIFVEGVKSFADVDRMKNHLTSQPGVTDLVLRLYDESMAQFEVQLGSSIRATELAGRMDKSQSLPLKVLESSDQLIRLKLD